MNINGRQCGGASFVYLANTPVTDAELAPIRSLPDLNLLSITGTQVSDAGREERKAAVTECEIQ